MTNQEWYDHYKNKVNDLILIFNPLSSRIKS